MENMCRLAVLHVYFNVFIERESFQRNASEAAVIVKIIMLPISIDISRCVISTSATPALRYFFPRFNAAAAGDQLHEDDHLETHLES